MFNIDDSGFFLKEGACENINLQGIVNGPRIQDGKSCWVATLKEVIR